jgi:hypothetical protein
MVPYLGDFDEDETVYIAFNTFTSDDPSASATITNLADADIKVHKDGGTTQLGTDGATVAINFDSITGNHLITIDTSAHSDYATGSDYHVRIEGTTVDGATINAWVGHFSILNRSHGADISAILADTNELQGDWVNGGRLDLLLDATLADTAELQGDLVNGGRLDLLIDAILADTNELQGDLANGGRLDLLIDAILADTNELQGDLANGGRLDLLIDAILADTNELQSDDIPASLSTITSHTSTLYTEWNNGGRLDLLIDSIIAKVDVVDGIVDNILVDTAEIGTGGAGLDDLGGMSSAMKAEVNAEVDTAFTTQMADSVPSDGAIATREQAIYMVVQMLSEMAISGTTMTVKKVDGSTTLMTFTLSDATNPTSITRAS